MFSFINNFIIIFGNGASGIKSIYANWNYLKFAIHVLYKIFKWQTNIYVTTHMHFRSYVSFGRTNLNVYIL
jgi:uncharacterized membrane protein